jgi:hypothetical protein
MSRGLEARMLRGMRRTLPLLVVIAAAALSLAPSAQARRTPRHAGTITGGVFTTSPAWDCGWEPDCIAWRQSGCSPSLAGREPALLTAIENVADMADGATTRTFSAVTGQPAGVDFGGVMVQFWTRDCMEVRYARWQSFYDTRYSGSRTVDFTVPARARWMTVTANDNANIAWSLTTSRAQP